VVSWASPTAMLAAYGLTASIVSGVGGAAMLAVAGCPGAVVARLRDEHGEPLTVQRRHLAKTSIEPGSSDGPLAIVVSHTGGEIRWSGPAAERAAARLLPPVNRFGATPGAVREAVHSIEARSTAEAYLRSLARAANQVTAPQSEPPRWIWGDRPPESGLFALSPNQRLALEMALHEESERRALEGELAELERAWREAEEIAAIADDLLIPASIRDTLARLRGRVAA
jgi:hypothetical protein